MQQSEERVHSTDLRIGCITLNFRKNGISTGAGKTAFVLLLFIIAMSQSPGLPATLATAYNLEIVSFGTSGDFKFTMPVRTRMPIPYIFQRL